MTLIDKESWDTLCEDTRRTVRNVINAREAEKQRIIKFVEIEIDFWKRAYNKEHDELQKDAIYSLKDIITKINSSTVLDVDDDVLVGVSEQ